MVHSRALKHEGGQTLAEFAIILPIFLLLLFAILDFGRAVYAYHVVANCAREGARFGQVSPGNTAGITAKAQNAAVGLDGELTVGVGPGPAPNTIRVDVSYTFSLITPLIGDIVGDSLVLHSASTMYTGR